MKKSIVFYLIVFLFSISIFAGDENMKGFPKTKIYKSPAKRKPTPKYVIVSPVNDKFLVNLFIDRGPGGFYQDGDSIKISVKSEVDCYISLFSIDLQDNIGMIFPTYYYQDNFVYGGKLTELKPRGGRRFEVGGSGMQVLYLVATKQRPKLFKEKKVTFQKNFRSSDDFNRYYSVPEDIDTYEQFFYALSTTLSEYPENSYSTATEMFFIPGEEEFEWGIVEVEASPEGHLYIDNIDFGYTPVTVTNIPVGEHRLGITIGKTKFIKDFNITPKRLNFYFNFTKGLTSHVEYPTITEPPEYPDDPFYPPAPIPVSSVIVDEVFFMSDARQKFEREIDEDTTLKIESVWKLNPEITQLYAEVERDSGSDVKIMKLNFFMGTIPYKGQKYIKTVDGYKYTITILWFKWSDDDKESGEMENIRMRILVERS